MTRTRNWCALGAAVLILGCSPAAGPDPVLAGNRGIARIILEDVLGKGKIAENERLYAENFKAHGLTQSVGRDEDREATRGWRTAFPDLKITIEQLIADGLNINVTLMFSMADYEAVARAYLTGLERCAEPSKVASVASFFVSRVDTKVDKALDAMGSPEAAAARGTAAVANAQLAYQAYLEIFEGTEFAGLRAAGARVQRCLWASTSAKDPAYRDVKYAEALIGPDTVDTMPRETIAAMLDHGALARTLDADFAGAAAAIATIEALGISMEQVTDELIDEGVRAFSASFDELIGTIEATRRALATA